MNNKITSLLKILPKDAEVSKIKEILSQLTDDEFNGNNGEEYYITFESKLMSKLDFYMKMYSKEIDLSDFVRRVCEDNYSDCCYQDFKVKIVEVENSLIISLSYI